MTDKPKHVGGVVDSKVRRVQKKEEAWQEKRVYGDEIKQSEDV